jgi:hypothetical protein
LSVLWLHPHLRPRQHRQEELLKTRPRHNAIFGGMRQCEAGL